MNRTWIVIAVLALLLPLAAPAEAAVPRLFNYQGTLTDGAGIPLSGPRDLTFKLYPDSAGGAPVLWQEQHLAVPVEQGLFQVMLGEIAAIPDSLVPRDTLWLGVTVGADPEMTPRQKLGAVFWALRAAVADSAGVAPLATHDHDDRYFTETELSASGTINDPANPVDWTKLKSVPAGFADGTDDVGTGGGDDGDWTISGSNIYSAVPGKVGIGTTTPRAKLTIEDDGGVLAAGSLYVGDTLGVNTAGSYLMWYPYKGAFRAGYVIGTGYWNDANIGRYTAAFGRNTKATQEGGFACGYSSEATQAWAVAGGRNSLAQGVSSVALGEYTTASGANSAAIGKYLTASAASSMVLGLGSNNAQRLTNNIANSLMVGFNSQKPALFVGGDYKRVGVNMSTPEFPLTIGSTQSGEDGSFLAQGLLNQGMSLTSFHSGVMFMWYPRKAAFRAGEVDNDQDWLDLNTGYWSTGLGRNVRTSGSGSAAVGSHLTASGTNAMILGSGIDGSNRLVNGTNNSLVVAFADTAATFFVGGPNDRVGVKTRAPQADFHVAGKARVDSFQLPTGASNGYVLMSDAAGKGSWQPASAVGDNDWTISGNDMYSNVSGKVGIKTPTPLADLHVAGKARVDSIQMPTGAANGYVLMSNATGKGAWQPASAVGDNDWTVSGSDMYSNVSGKVGIKTPTPLADLHVAGKARVDSIQMPTGAANGYVLMSNAAGKGSWQPTSAVGDNDWTISGNDMYSNVSGKVGIGTSAPTTKLDVLGNINGKRKYLLDAATALSMNGPENVFIGTGLSDSINPSVTCSANVFIGKNVGGMFDNPYFEDGVRRSVIIGSHAGVTNHGDDNTFVGEGSGFHNIHGGGNVFVGRASGYWNNSGGRNTCLGVESGPEYVYPDTPSDCVLLGYGASSLLSNRLVISNANATLIDGDFETGQVHVGSAGGLLGTLYVGAIVDPSLVLGPSSEWYIGKDDSDADKLKIGTGHTVGSGIKLSIASNGIVRAGGNASGSDSSYVILNESLRGLKAVSTDSVGVFGKSTDGIGVKAVSTRNYGLHATSTDQEAVVGISTNDRAVYGKSTNSYSGYFDGSVMVVGYLSKGGGSFLIDHPLDPENKLLRHNFVESPENLLIYRGKVKLDGKGEAAVTLPDYFAALTKESDATVNLTSIGRPFSAGYDWASDHVSFTVYGEAHREVAWMVMADRDDPVIRQLGAPVEERKTEGSKTCTPGRLLYPTAFGYPESKGMGYEERQALEGTD